MFSVSHELEDDVFLFQLLTLWGLNPQRSAQIKSFLLKVNQPQKCPVKKVSGRQHSSGVDLFSHPKHKPKYFITVEQPETEIADPRSNPGVGEVNMIQI